jgi:hypothetical protein
MEWTHKTILKVTLAPWYVTESGLDVLKLEEICNLCLKGERERQLSFREVPDNDESAKFSGYWGSHSKLVICSSCTQLQPA